MLKFVIWSPEYTEGISGVIALHLLAKNLAEEGYPVVISTRTTMRNSKALTIDRINELVLNPDETVVIYPEIAIGNPFNAKHVVRWLLNTPGTSGGDGVYNRHDIVYKLSEEISAPDESQVKGLLRMNPVGMEMLVDQPNVHAGDSCLAEAGPENASSFHVPDEMDMNRVSGDERSSPRENRAVEEYPESLRSFIRDCERYVAERNEMPESRVVIDVVIASNCSDIDSYKNVARCINSLVVSAHDDVAFNIIVAESSTDVCFDAATANAAPHRCTTVYPGVPYSTTEYQRFGAMFAHADTIVVCSPSYRFTVDWARTALQTLQAKPNDPLSVSGPAKEVMSTSEVFRMAFGVNEPSRSGNDECVMYRRSVWEQTVMSVDQDRLSTEETRPQAIEELFTTEAQVIL